ncbi:MAG TPA: adenosine deaminase [Xanthobacteraceae bacterium]|nr:adenosine deaminase [Xanthobacteraceae bacterium]
MRGRIVLAVIFLAAFILLFRVTILAGEFDAVVTAAQFEKASETHTTLRAFFRRMPKGGDLHTHLSGAVYAERFIAWAAQEGLCVDLENVVLAKPQCDRAGARPLSDAMREQKLYDRLVNAFSMRDFLPTPAVPTGHDEFFAVFDRFGAVSGSRLVDMTVDQLKLYDGENVQYVEFMVSSWCPNDREKFGRAVAGASEDAAKLAALEASGLAECVAGKRNDLAAAFDKISAALGCEADNTQAGCRVIFRYIVQIYRDNAPDEVFVQTATAAALICAEPRLVGLNLVGPEDYLVARRDYTRQMEIVRFLATDVPVALHAGELWLGLVPPPDLTFHIRQAIEIAGARRIGHGVTLAFERDAQGLLAQMRARPTVVEINLTSNDLILGVRGKDHPFPVYLAAGVPVVLSSDDAGVSRIDLTNEYFRAARDYGLGYPQLKAIARNSLDYSFLGDDQKRDQLERFERRCAEFERSVASQQSPLQNAMAVIRAAVAPPG